MFTPIKVRALPGYKLWLEYVNGVQGVVDLSYLAGKGVFALWNDYAAFEKVFIGEGGEIAWNKDLDLCPDALYLKITGKTPEEVFPNLKSEMAYA